MLAIVHQSFPARIGIVSDYQYAGFVKGYFEAITVEGVMNWPGGSLGIFRVLWGNILTELGLIR